MSDTVRMIIVAVDLLIFGFVVQQLLVQWRHPQAVWLWCDTAHLCAPSGR